MTKNVEGISFKKSKRVINGKPNLPTPDKLVEGEIAINYAEGYETISTKNENGGITLFSSDDYYTKKKLGSDFTGENSAKTVTDAIGEAVGELEAHTADTDIHITSAERTAWNDKVDFSDLVNYFDGVKYELSGSTHVINFYNDNTIKATIDATDFIKDGMIDTVELVQLSGDTYLRITWNTDAGKEVTDLNLGDMFDADNYYTKTQIDNKLGSGFTVSSVTEVIESNERVVSNALNYLNENKLDASAYTPTDLSNYYKKNETSGATELSNAFAEKSDTSHTHASSAVTSMDGYAMAASGNPITTSDTLNQAIGKLEKMIDEFKEYVSQKELVISAALNDLNDRMGGMALVKLTQAEYDALTVKDPNTMYVIND